MKRYIILGVIAFVVWGFVYETNFPITFLWGVLSGLGAAHLFDVVVHTVAQVYFGRRAVIMYINLGRSDANVEGGVRPNT